MSNITVAIVQHSCTDNYDKNLQSGIHGIEQAADKGADLVLLPELSLGRYFCIEEVTDYFNLSESIPGPSTKALQTAAKENNIIIVATLFEKRAMGIYHNTAIVLDKDGSLAGTYQKMHIPDDPGFFEKYYFTPGDKGFIPIDTSIGRLGVMICWDQWYPEAARIMALSGADLLLYPSAIGWNTNDANNVQNKERNAWIAIQRSHAIANSLPILSSNRIGIESDSKNNLATQFWGSSFITDQQGEILAEASIEKEEVIIAELDLDNTEKIRQVWPYFRDRRIDAYENILKRHIDQ